MVDNFHNLRGAHCYLIVVETQSMRILVDGNGQGTRLPEAWIPLDQRAAASLTTAIMQQYDLCTIQLALFARASRPGYCAVHEILSIGPSAQRELCFASLDEAGYSQLTSEEWVLVRRIMDGKARELGRFAQPGWINALLQKTGLQLARTTQPSIHHINQGIDFCLLRFKDLNGRTLWFKAVGKPNLREYAVTLELARRFPSFLPKIVGAIPEWNGWVMEHIQGVPLSDADGIHSCKEALTTLAILQQESVRHLTPLMGAGIRDWRFATIASLIEPLFAEAQQAMQAQTSKNSTPISYNELNQLKEEIRFAFLEYMNAGLPETLLHGDIGHGNIISTPNRPVFLDWAEASIGQPFICAEHLLAGLARENSLFAERQQDLRCHYALQWRTHLRPNEFEKMIALSPAIGAFVYCLFVWDANRDRQDFRQAWPIMRSLLRRTRRELDKGSEVFAWLRN